MRPLCLMFVTRVLTILLLVIFAKRKIYYLLLINNYKLYEIEN